MKTSELLQEVKNYCRVYNIECANGDHLIEGDHFTALNEAIKHFKQIESEEKDGNSK